MHEKQIPDPFLKGRAPLWKNFWLRFWSVSYLMISLSYLNSSIAIKFAKDLKNKIIC